MSIQVLKADGTKEVFKAEKLKRSLKRSGATNAEISNITKEIESTLHEGITTQEIYRNAFELLRENSSPSQARYSLRRALFGLGPTGFPFEDFLARLFAEEGFTTTPRVNLRGKCTMHELDVAAYNEHDSFVVEAKFHSRPGIKSDLQVALYSFARLIDLKDTKICNLDVCGIKRLMLVTNTKFTSTAQSYAECAGLELLSWNYPQDNNLQDRIEKAGLYPITVLQSLTQSQKRTLLAAGIIVCKDLLKKPDILRQVHLSATKKGKVLEEAATLCST